MLSIRYAVFVGHFLAFRGSLPYFYSMAKAVRNIKKKIPASYRIDGELYGEATKKCLKQSVEQGKRVTLSEVVEELISEWVKRKV
jgi:hypothetical protein